LCIICIIIMLPLWKCQICHSGIIVIKIAVIICIMTTGGIDIVCIMLIPIVIIAIFAFVFFAAVVVVVVCTPTRSAPRRVSSLLVLTGSHPYIFYCLMMSHPPPAHPRQMDFSFMLLPPSPPAIPFPSLPLCHLPTPLFPAVSFPIQFVTIHHHLLFVCGVFFVIIVVETPHQFLLMGGWAPLHSPCCLPPLRTPSLFASPFLTTFKWHTII
jgi:hypothetical protein